MSRRTRFLDHRRFGAGLESISQATAAAILTIWVEGHKDTGPALSCGTFATETLDLSIGVYFVVFEDRHLDLLALVFDFLGSAVCLLLPLLPTTAEAKNQMEGRFLLDVIVA